MKYKATHNILVYTVQCLLIMTTYQKINKLSEKLI